MSDGLNPLALRPQSVLTMISRRNIRVKVMQTLYALEQQEATVQTSDPSKFLQKQFDLSSRLFLYIVHFLTGVARYAETDSRNRASKHLPSAQDLSVNTKLAGNELLWRIMENPGYQEALKAEKLHLLDDQELLRKIYLDLSVTDIYAEYLNEQGRNRKSEKDILEFILTDIMLPNERFTGFLEENFPNWDDDGSMIVQLLQNFLAKPQSFNLQQFVSREKTQYGKLLLSTAIEKEALTMEYIKPRLKNWDAERIAVLDMILMRLGVCEFLFFETIPPKVTINEYIDLAKEYSTPQSGQFVNGILDNIHKELVSQNKMHKVAFKAG